MFTSGATITPDMEDAADLAEEMINPTLKAGPFPQAIKNDPATQAAYMEAKRQEAIYNTSGEVLRDLYLASLDLRQGFDAYQRELDLTLTTVIDKLQERQYADAPIGSIGQSRRGGDVVIDPPGRPGGPDGPLDTTNSDCVGLLPENPLTTISLDVDVNGGWNPNYSGRPADGATVDIEWDLGPSESCTIEVGPNVNLTETINGSTGQVSFTFPGGSPLQYVLTCDLSCVPGRWHRIAQTSQ